MRDPRFQLFCDESGIDSDSETVAIGLLSTSYESRRELLKIIQEVRGEFHFYEEIHFKKMSNLRYKVYLRLIERTLPHVRLYIGVINKKNLDTRWFGRKWYVTLNYFTKKVVRRFVNPSMNAVLYLDFKTREKRDNGLDYLMREVNFEVPFGLKAVEAIDSKTSELMQLCDLYTGLARCGFQCGYIIEKNFVCDMKPSGRKEQLFYEFSEMFTLYPGKHQKKCVRVWEWQPKESPGSKWRRNRRKYGF